MKKNALLSPGRGVPASEARGASKNRLIGWLVSYQNDKLGQSIELRAGRTMVSSAEAGSDHCITLQADSISNPHLALSASAQHNISVQDIFSEAGSYIRRASDNEECQLSGPTDLQHGDWLRIGNSIKFQVCLIDGPGR